MSAFPSSHSSSLVTELPSDSSTLAAHTQTMTFMKLVKHPASHDTVIITITIMGC